MKKYTPPTPEDLQKLKEELGYTGVQMADLTGLASGSQWRKYTSGEAPRAISMQMLFYTAAKLVLSTDQVGSVYNKMREIGADIED